MHRGRPLCALTVVGRLAAGALVIALLPACGLMRARPVPVQHARGALASGVLWRDTFTGIGAEAGPASLVTLHYTARIHEGPEVDSTYGRGTPETISLADPPVLGLADGVRGMRVGGRRLLVVPPWRAYGERGIPGLVPPGATLDFHVELLEVLEE